jgi:hypothetical protein
MANQDYLTFGGIGKDPSGAYSQIETGWNPAYTDGVVTWRPTDTTLLTTLANLGNLPQTATKLPSSTGWTEATPDTYQIQNASGKTVATNYVSIVVTDNTGTAGNGTFTLADDEIASISASGLITFEDGTVFVTASKMVIAYNADIVDIAYVRTQGLPVKGAKMIKVSHPASSNAEVTAHWQWTDNEDLSIDGLEKATWENISGASASSVSHVLDGYADWVKMDKMAYIRLEVISTASNITDTVASVTVYTAGNGAYVRHDDDRTSLANVGISIGGMGADPS